MASDLYFKEKVIMFISDAFAQTAGAAAPQTSTMGVLFQIVLIAVVFYFFLIRPNQKRMKQHQTMLMAIKPGDEVLTGGGIYAKVISTEGQYDLIVEMAKGIQVKVNRLTIRDVVLPETAKPANSNAKSKK